MAAKMSTQGPLALAVVDARNPASVAMPVRAFFLHPKQTGIHCILNTSPVDFSVRPYGSKHATVEHIVGRDKARTPLKETPSWIDTIPDELKPFFERDKGCDDSEVREDTILAMQATAVTLTSILNEATHDYQDCMFYMNKESIGDVLLDERHAYRTYNFIWRLNDDELAEYKRFIDAPTTGDVLRGQIRKLCQQYIQRMFDEVYIDGLDDMLSDIKMLDSHLGKNHSCVIALAGAPLTEALPHVETLRTAQLFMQYNMIDAETKEQVAMDLRNDVEEEHLPHQVLVMGSAKNSWLELTDDELNDLFTKSPQLRDYFRHHKQESREDGGYWVHEVVMAVAAEATAKGTDLQSTASKMYIIVDADEMLALMSENGEAGPSSGYPSLSDEQKQDVRLKLLQSMKTSPPGQLVWWQ
ncbi:hypothetical protein SCP_1400310 [Sparassis crispa]|uniref:Uncharacterized protein n=1 Tax=Sparassis crispa TaxID=139825 RepID=A0A401H2E6_9APHY|nr:hypothetical protein SCP_1400310 [Sparassis crispa]GBE88626.1 hypothetical protein SCP_1400310 [Sparassis crispa]